MANILLIEDSRDVADMLTLLLTLKSHHVETAFSTKEAKQKIENSSFDLIMIDVLLGSDSGKELCKEIRRMNKQVPIILMSANPALLKNYAECEANAIIEKPFNIKQITDQISTLLH
jgi:DNA-binding response OmpR family regulator